ncbi:hypothetical protein K5D34_00435 [Pseudomonas cichorii]|nr:hypothetical protein [Pseudomonas cichorii]MBX8508157.1 hypothetical protein [Pseudomonas cichorii]MBX8519194.1 hypothetical protein [Pseudomonas cichorii]MBX8526228.1 hypothetical protein [Pseudomonas cichorii]MBX8538636.1 hypothetical protein [Pseudomonas cichorii]MBX8552290.1 hypothetical protein [Pseudomonas cichorii]
MKPQDSKEFYECYKTSKGELARCGLEVSVLSRIYEDYERQVPYLEQTATSLAAVIQKIPGVHSVRWRVKEASHVISKIIRKHSEGSEKYRDIDSSNYTSIIHDLVGLRALHLYKSSMLSIDDEVRKALDVFEGPTAYVRQGDSVCAIEDKGFVIKEHDDAYRSVHYIIQSAPFKGKVYSELQVRTIFEEGWAEIDHDIRYPNYSDNVLVKQFLGIFNRLCGGADEMGDFVKTLTIALSAEKTDAYEPVEETSSQISALKENIYKLNSLVDSPEQRNVLCDLERNLKELESHYSQALAVSQNAVNDSYKGLGGWGLAARVVSDIITASAAAEKIKQSQYNIVDMGAAVTLKRLSDGSDDK